MHPAFSVLFFTVTSGFGYGLLFCVLLSQLLGLTNLPFDRFLTIVIAATVLFTLGLLSSTQHLANPKNAWRSFVRFRTSWLSREAVLAVLGYPLFALTVLAVFLQWPSIVVQGLNLLSLIWIVALVYCTAMIYASLKTIPQWNTHWVPVAFLVFALLGGLLILGWFIEWTSQPIKLATLIIILLGVVVKLAYFRAIGQPTRSSINTATSFSQAQVTLFDAGHSSKNFSQREFIYEVGPKTTQLARRLVFVLIFALPAALISFVPENVATLIAVISAYIGLLLERWLFFVEAKHVVRHYYGE